MFLGHFGVGFAAKRYAPSASLGVLFLVAQFFELCGRRCCCLGSSASRSTPAPPW